MSNSTSLRTAGAMALIVAFVHQLGACPCGCLDHNMWFQAARSALGMDLASGDASPPSGGPSSLFVDDDHCHAEHPTPFLAGRRLALSELINLGEGAAVFAQGPACAPSLAPCFYDGFCATGQPHPAARASIRATLQVFLI